ncbi:Aste57867_9945 [Aphanomyces stellatus]|uniref:Aste57867_9945 protein n=1 Tax=Aphanomyces stellatus TaxID=120398 RepID=A0A485KPS4_9STRA|nr:hypothetical protein As57867_009906 [Aphanomyces stellatus]VFT86823.1 Aste57867_9945 [Aphanomyces stellatus]
MDPARLLQASAPPKSDFLRPALHVIMWIWIFAYAGVAARIGLTHAATSIEASQGRPTLLTAMGLSFFLPNVVGCFIMGLCQPLKARFKQFDAVWSGITTGFCGCCTTFATWELHTAFQYLTDLPANATFVFFTQLLCCFGAHWGGIFTAKSICTPPPAAVDPVARLRADVSAIQVEDSDDKWQDVLRALDAISPQPVAASSFDEDDARIMHILPRLCTAMFGLSFVLITAAAILHQTTWTALWIAPVGALLRFELGKRFNTSALPYGTLAANIVASAFDCVVVIWITKPAWVEAAILTGFCGSLSTVSSWINELNGMHPRAAFRYAAITHVVALGISLIILGASQQVQSITL